MTLTSSEVWQNIGLSGLASANTCRHWAAEVAQQLPASESTSGKAVLEQLVMQERLTRYQAQVLSGQDSGPLNLGTWRVLEPVENAVFSQWYVVSAGESPSWCRRLDQTQLATLKLCLPSLNRAKALAGKELAGVQRLVSAQAIDGTLEVLMQPLEGKLLGAAHSGLPGKVPQITAIIRQLSAALAELHAANIIHGRVLPDRVLANTLPSTPEFTLLIDPLCQRTAASAPQPDGILDSVLGEWTPAQFVAPEFMAPDPRPSMATDVYSLGCLWWWLLTGQPPHPGPTASEALASHARELPELPSNIELSADLRQCLRHALGRNLDSRFANALQFRTALALAESEAGSTPQLQTPQPPVDSPKTSQPTTDQTNAEPTVSAPAPERVPAPVDSGNRATEPSQQPTPKQPTPKQPTPKQPTPKQPTPKQPTPKQPTPKQPTPKQPTPKQPTPKQPTSKHPTPKQPTPKQPTPKQRVAQPLKSRLTTAAENPKSLSSQRVAAKPKLQSPEPSPSVADIQTENISGEPTAASPVQAAHRGRKRRSRPNKWLLPVVGGCGFLIILLTILSFTGALQPGNSKRAAKPPPAYVPPAKTPTQDSGETADPRFRVVEDASQLWVPPRPPSPIPVNYLPPGSQLFVSIRPASLISNAAVAPTREALAETIEPLLSLITQMCGFEATEIQQATLALYPPLRSGEIPQMAVRVRLAAAVQEKDVLARWPGASPALVNGVKLYADDAVAYYLHATDAEEPSITEFSAGSIALMKEAVELSGQAGPMYPQVEKLWRSSDALSDLSVLVSPPFLFTEGRWLVEQCPERLRVILTSNLATDRRAALLQTTLTPTWYSEILLVGRSDTDAAAIAQEVRESLAGLADKTEAWFVDEQPHPAWGAIAIRFPQMLRVLDEYSRTGIENGVAIVNSYLPTEAAPSLLLASYMALQDAATMASGSLGNLPNPAQEPLSLEEYLSRKIRIRFEQEPIEVALQLVADEANDGLPAGTPKLRFALDGDAFELAGITRNQQLRSFNHPDSSVRDVLTDIAKRGNPITTVTDTRELDQKLIWTLTPDPTSPGLSMVSLTTRTAAAARGDALSVEFAAE